MLKIWVGLGCCDGFTKPVFISGAEMHTIRAALSS